MKTETDFTMCPSFNQLKLSLISFLSQDGKKAPPICDDATVPQAAPEVVRKIVMWDPKLIN